MNKTDYLVNKGQIPDPANGTMWLVKSTRAGVNIFELPIWEIKDWGVKKIYIFKDAPFEMEIDEGQDYGESHGHGTGFGDLWSWSYFGSLDKELAHQLYEKEIHRVQMKYMINI